MDETRENMEKKPIFIYELAKKYRIKSDKIEYILFKYGSMDRFIEVYLKDQLDDADKKVLKDNLVYGLTIDIAQDDKRETVLLAQYLYEGADIFRRDMGHQKGRVIFFDGEKLMEQFHKLSVRQQKIIGLRCGMYEGKIKSNEQEGYRTCSRGTYSISEQYQDEKESKGMARLDRGMRLSEARETYWSDEDTIGLPKEEVEKRARIFDKIYHSNLIFLPDKGLGQLPDSITHSERVEFATELSRIRQVQRKNIELDSIRKLNLPIKLQRSLESVGIKTITQLKDKSARELMRTKKLGKKSVERIQAALEEIYPELREVREQEPREQEPREEEPRESELEKLKATRDRLAQKVEALKSQLQDAEQLLASYDALLNGDAQKDEGTPNLDEE